jgi:small-conductance mechanosensitive channel
MYCLDKISSYYEVSSDLELLLNVSMDVAKALSIILITARIFSQDTSKDDETNENTEDSSDETENVNTSTKVIVCVSLFAIATLGVSFFGYPGLATYIFDRFFLTIILIAIFMIIRTLISDLLRRSIVFWISTFKLRRRLLSKVDFFMSLLVTPVLAMLFLYSLLNLWGVPGKFMLNGLKKLVFGFKVGGIQISLVAIVTGLLVFLVSITIVRVLKTRISNNLLNRINMDEGIKHSLISGFTFTGFIIACILAIVAMGVDLSNLAVIAGALSVGIGFGLQDVIKNLVSGIIILFERPFKVGDWVIINGDEGKIKQINIRSTELETWTRQSVIIPNATLISSSLVNLTHDNNWQRQAIAVGVSYDADAEVVTKLLLECARSCKKVAKVPAPYVIFKDFGSSSLDFEIRFYVSDIWNGWDAASDIRYEILKRFREENINIAYPQLVIHKGSQDTSVKGWQTNV